VIHRVRFLISVWVLAHAGAAFLHAETAHVHAVPGSVRSEKLSIRGESGQAQVESRALETQVELPSLKTAILDVVVLYDPHSKLFWWNANTVPTVRQIKGVSEMLPRDSVIFLTKASFVFFWNGWASGGHIFIRESKEQFSSLDEGQAHVFQVLEDRRGDIDEGKFLHSYKEVVFQGLERDFLYSKGDIAGPRRGPRLRDVTRVGNNWRIVEDSPNGGQAVITLNDAYEVLSTNVEPAK